MIKSLEMMHRNKFKSLPYFPISSRNNPNRRRRLRQKREASDIKVDYHVVYKRMDKHLQHSSDYGKILNSKFQKIKIPLVSTNDFQTTWKLAFSTVIREFFFFVLLQKNLYLPFFHVFPVFSVFAKVRVDVRVQRILSTD